MSGIQPTTTGQILDLTEASALAEYSERLRGLQVDAETVRDLEALTLESNPRERARQFAEVFRKLDNQKAFSLFRAAGQSSCSGYSTTTRRPRDWRTWQGVPRPFAR